MKLIKLTDDKNQTFNNTQWAPGVTHTVDGDSKELCNGHWIHAYRDIYLALLMNPLHGNFNPVHVWEAKGEIGLDTGDKVGCKSLTTIKRLLEPRITMAMCVRFAILCALECYSEWEEYDVGHKWLNWAESYSTSAESAAESAAWSAAWAAESAAESAAKSAARSAAWLAASAASAAGKLIDLAHKACKGE